MMIRHLPGVIDSRFSLQRLNAQSIWDASDPNGDGTIPVDGASISTIVDTGLNGNDFGTASGGVALTYKTAIINSQNVFRLNGTTQYLTCAHTANNNWTGAMTVMAILKTNTIAASISRVFGKIGAASGFSYGRHTDKMLGSFRSIADYTSTTTGDFDTTNFGVYMWVYKNTGFDFYKNGSLLSSVATASIVPGTDPMFFGNFNGALQFWNGDIQLLTWWFRQLNATEIAAANNYAMHRIGI